MTSTVVGAGPPLAIGSAFAQQYKNSAFETRFSTNLPTVQVEIIPLKLKTSKIIDDCTNF